MAIDCVTLDRCRVVDYDRPSRPPQAEALEQKVRKKTQAASETSGSAVIEEQGQAEQKTQEAEGVRAVIRLLQQGHFRGVADVRLRINFHEEIADMERQQLQALAEENITGLQQTVADSLSAMAAVGLPEEEAAELAGAFEQTVAGLLQSPPGTEPFSRDMLVAGLESAFKSLLAALPVESQATSTAMNEPPEQRVIAGPASDDDSAGEIPALQTLREELTSTFSAALEVFTDALDGGTLMPAPSAPRGNGVAYEKFLAIYNDLRGTSPQTLPAGKDSIDTLA